MYSLSKASRKYYDEFSPELLGDYANGNPRIESAIAHALRWIPDSANRILDIGCGIGWSTSEIKRAHPDAVVLGVDISPEAISTARNLFEGAGISFESRDITEPGNIPEPAFDAIVMLDVYEHISKDRRRETHLNLAKALSYHGTVILTCPSVFYQEYLRQHQPETLQPVDEDVAADELSFLARDIKGHLVHLEYVDIWHTNDYLHAVIRRHPALLEEAKHANKRVFALESKNVRRRRVTSRPKVLKGSETGSLPVSNRPTICVFSPNQFSYSETFIRAHIQYLPANVQALNSGWFPTLKADGKPWFPRPLYLFYKGKRFYPRRLASLAQSVGNLELVRFLKSRRVAVVLAEYGPTGVSVMDACVQARVPFVTHFHGFDAYDRSALDQFGPSYPRMFALASGIIAVSHEMENQLLDLGAPRDKLHYNPYGIDISIFTQAEPSSNPPVFVAMGNFVDKKAPQVTLLAFSKALEECPEARLIMGGGGDLLEACKQLAKALKISTQVEFLGPLPHAQVAPIMQQARAFVQHSLRTSYGDSEGTPVAVLEAGASGLPVISTRHAGIKDVVIEGETGFLVEETDIEGMAKYMVLLAKNPGLAGQLGRNARERICANYPMEKSINQLWQILSSVSTH